ncbi:2-oxoacid:acceptor oxidoreductase family protein [Streptomyces sp. NBC_01264]|uniref:2-oxoacid:acceptor oxidoreductase family protein n=1 Tax=Streptomyces sp. NBC_01264 TaxID=2903804 RepID=UPI00224E4523|nr:2-oxoacid:acceptor oxidoreductase family protein [Streptomyces sp. NBC_01264]MCX4781711.1 2-oxoacid:acceptor oxidoreductase family protein [Streptomyces sp. NBC_01264]
MERQIPRATTRTGGTMERELLLTGIGGQGIQLAAHLLARALAAEGRDVQLFGSYGGMMRGGSTDATLVAGDREVQSPPTVSLAWSAIVMHDAHAPALPARLRPGGLLVRNSTLCGRPGDTVPDHVVLLDLPATAIAAGLGSVAAGTLVALGAYARATAIVGPDALERALTEVLPPYRHGAIAVNIQALHAGHSAVPEVRSPAWAGVAA